VIAEALENAITNWSQGQHIIVPVMGGDGTLAGLLKSILDKSPIVEANLHMFAFAPLPFGTGNDLSRSTGWGPIHGALPAL